MEEYDIISYRRPRPKYQQYTWKDFAGLETYSYTSKLKELGRDLQAHGIASGRDLTEMAYRMQARYNVLSMQ